MNGLARLIPLASGTSPAQARNPVASGSGPAYGPRGQLAYRGSFMRASCAAALVLAAFAMPSAVEAQPRSMRGQSDPAQGQQPQQQAPQSRSEKQFPTNVSYVAVSVRGRPTSGDRPAMTLDGSFRMRGFGGCRNYSAVAYPLREQGIAVGPLALTKRSCDKARMDQEQAFLVALRTAQKWDTQNQNSVLILRGPNGEIRFERAL